MIGQYEVAFFIILTVYGVHTEWTGFHQIMMQTICVFKAVYGGVGTLKL